MEQTLGKRIIAHRKRLGLTQDALAERLGVTAQAVSKWENDLSCPDIGMLPRLAAIFGTTTDELLGIERQECANPDPAEEEAAAPMRGADNSRNSRFSSEFSWSSGRLDALAFAVLVLLAGSLTLLSRLLVWDVGFWSILWPSALLVYGIRHMLSGFSFLRLSVALVGLYYLCANLIPLNTNLIFPIILLVSGISLLVDALRMPRRSRANSHRSGQNSRFRQHRHVEGEHFDCAASFCEDTQYIVMSRLSSGNASVSFGEMVLDLSGVETLAEDCCLRLSCSFGELTLKVPQRFQVSPKSNNFFSGTTVSGQPAPSPDGTIFLETSASFGEIRIRYI